MSEQVIKNGNVMERSRTRTIAQVAMLGAVAGVLMNFEVPLPFLAPSFYQLDFSEIPALHVFLSSYADNDRSVRLELHKNSQRGSLPHHQRLLS